MNSLTTALRHAEDGLPVFPLAPHSKKPLLKGGNGCHDATTDKAQIYAWYEQSPQANIGVRMGEGLVGIDVDAHKGASVEDWNLPPTRTAHTAHGGYHYYFRYDGALPCRQENALAPG